MSDPKTDARKSQGFINRPTGPVSQVYGPQRNISDTQNYHEDRRTITVAPERVPLKIEPAELEAAQQQLDALPLVGIPALKTLPDGSRMPLARNPLFVGRTDALVALAAALKRVDAAICPTVAIAGMAGVGKTQLASEFVHRYGQYFAGGVFWLSFADASAVPGEIAACGSARMPGLRAGFDALSPEEQVQEVRAAWHGPLPRLLVFDNCESEELLARWRPTSGKCCVVLTSRRPRWATGLGVQLLALNVLQAPESLTLLRKHRPDLAPEDQDLHKIAAELGHLPLALHMAGSFLVYYQNTITPAEYFAQLRSPTLLQHPSFQRIDYSPTSHEQDVGRTFALSYERLDPTDPIDLRARALLARAAYLAPGELITWDLLKATLEPAATDYLDEDALRRLIDAGLLEDVSSDTFRLHRLLAAFVRTVVDDPAVQQAVEQALLDIAAHAKEAHTPKLPPALAPHLRSATDEALGRADAQAARLCSAFAEDLAANGDYAGARPYAEQALAIRERVLGPEHSDTASSLNNLAMLLRAQGEYTAARPLYERALAIRERVLGPEHPDTAMSLNNLAWLLHDQGEYAAARPLYERALAIREQVLGLEHPDTASSLNNLAGLLRAQGEYAAARPLYEQVLAINEQVLGPAHPTTAMSLNNLAALLCDQGEYAAARPLLERAQAINEQALGPEHPTTANSLNGLAWLLRNQGEYATAQPLLERSLAIREQVLGSEHPDTANSLNSLALVLYEQGDYTSAKPMVERALDVYDRVFDPLHPDTFYLLANLAQMHLFHGNKLQARQFFTRALAVAERHRSIQKVTAQQMRRQLAQIGGPFKNWAKPKPRRKKP